MNIIRNFKLLKENLVLLILAALIGLIVSAVAQLFMIVAKNLFIFIFNNKENILNGELCILKDVIQHWQMDEIYTFLDFLVENKVFKYILICNCCNQRINNPKNNERNQPLSSDLFPLKKYKPVKVYKYHSKEVSVIYT